MRTAYQAMLEYHLAQQEARPLAPAPIITFPLVPATVVTHRLSGEFGVLRRGVCEWQGASWT